MAITTALIAQYLPINIAKIVLSFFGERSNDFDNAKFGLWEYCLNTKNIEQGLRGACLGGNLLIAKMMMRRGARQTNYAISYAIKGNHLKLIKHMVENGAKVNSDYAYFGRHHSIEIAEYFIKKCNVNINAFLRHVVSNGNYRATKYLLENGATNLNDAISVACIHRKYTRSKGQKYTRCARYQKIINLLIEKGADDCLCRWPIESHLLQTN